MIRNELEKALRGELKEIGVRGPVVELEHPADSERGDYATNAALVYAKKLGRDPIELAGDLVQGLKKRNIKYIEKITVAGFGFINFHLSGEFFAQNIEDILEAKKFGAVDTFKGEKTIIEYTDPNIFKVFHIGHLMSNTVGEALSRLIEWNGAEVKRANYQGDVGMHIAKAIFAMKNSKLGIVKEKVLGSTKSRVAFLGQVYAEGAGLFESDKESAKKIKAINKKIYDKSDAIVNALYDLGRGWSLDYFATIYDRVGTKFDFYFFESKTWPAGKQIVEENIGAVFTKSDGAVVYGGEDEGLHTRVFINSEGLPTYEAKDLGLMKKKSEIYDFDKSIVVTASEQTEYFKVVLAASHKIFPQLASKTTHIAHGLMVLPSGKMSSRTGDVVAAEDLLGQAKEKVQEKMADRNFSSSQISEVAELVSIAAIKFAILKQAPGKDVVFDFDKSISFEGDSGPYLQYTAVRAGSILKKAKKLEIKVSSKRLLGTDILPLERLVYQLPEVIERAGIENSPQLVVSYLLQLASTFNSFYASTKIVDEKDANAPYYLALTKATKIALTNGLEVLGIKVPVKM